MITRPMSCVHDGDTYLGTFADTGRGAEASVTVRYGAEERTAPIGTQTVNGAAQRLLGDLVRDRLGREDGIEAL